MDTGLHNTLQKTAKEQFRAAVVVAAVVAAVVAVAVAVLVAVAVAVVVAVVAAIVVADVVADVVAVAVLCVWHKVFRYYFLSWGSQKTTSRCSCSRNHVFASPPGARDGCCHATIWRV